jgi:hypothetical protein
MDLIVRSFSLYLVVIVWAVGPLHAGSVHADGLLRVEGATWQGTRVFIVPATGQAYEFELTSARFTLLLAQNERYMLSFERAGCPTKQVLFDTHIPDGAPSGDLTFPFQVTLTHLPESERFEYEGPVGFVRYSVAAADLVFTTQYRLKQQENMTERLDVLRLVAPHSEAPQGTPVSSASFIETPLVAVRAEPVLAAVTPVPLAPIATALVERVTVERIAVRGPGFSQGTLTFAPIHVEPASLGMLPEREVPSVEPILALEQVAPSTSKPTVPLVDIHVDRADAPPLCTHYEVVIESRRVTYITRPKLESGCTELRKVVHAYGAVFYFHDRSSITERMYETALAADEAAVSMQ